MLLLVLTRELPREAFMELDPSALLSRLWILRSSEQGLLFFPFRKVPCFLPVFAAVLAGFSLVRLSPW